MTRTQRTYVVAAAVAAHRDRCERQPGRVLLAVVGLGRARVPRADDRAPHPRPASTCLAACASRSPGSWSRSPSGSALSARLVDQHGRLRFAKSSACSSTSRLRSPSRWSFAAATGRPSSRARPSASCSSSPYALATRLVPRSTSARLDDRDQRVSALERRSGTGTRSGCSQRWACIARARRRCARSARVTALGIGRRVAPVLVTCAVLHVLARRVGRRSPSGSSRCRARSAAAAAAVDRCSRRPASAICHRGRFAAGGADDREARLSEAAARRVIGSRAVPGRAASRVLRPSAGCARVVADRVPVQSAARRRIAAALRGRRASGIVAVGVVARRRPLAWRSAKLRERFDAEPRRVAPT